jgi:hypothetical protein
VTALIAMEERVSSSSICASVSLLIYECVVECVPIAWPPPAIFFTRSGYFVVQNSTMKKVETTFSRSMILRSVSV